MTEQDAQEEENLSNGEPELKERLLAKADAAESEEKAQLQELVDVAMGLKGARPSTPTSSEPEAIEHITTGQIKSMRQVSAQRIHDKEPVTSQFAQTLFKIYDGISAMFSFSADKTKEQCIIKGHKCSHCGQRFDASNVTVRDAE